MALAGLGQNTSYKEVKFSILLENTLIGIPEGEQMDGLRGWLRINNPTDPQLPQIDLTRE